MDSRAEPREGGAGGGGGGGGGVVTHARSAGDLLGNEWYLPLI